MTNVGTNDATISFCVDCNAKVAQLFTFYKKSIDANTADVERKVFWSFVRVGSKFSNKGKKILYVGQTFLRQKDFL